MSKEQTSKSEKHFLRQLFEEGIKNLIRLLGAILFFMLIYLCFFERDKYYLFVQTEMNASSELYILKTISNHIIEIKQSSSKYSSRYSPYFAEPPVSNLDLELEVYSNLSIKNVLRYLNLIPKTIDCTIMADSGGFYGVISIDTFSTTDSTKNLHLLLQLCAEKIVEHIEPKSLLPHYYVNHEYTKAENLACDLIANLHEKEKSFNKEDSTLLKDFDIWQIYSSTLIEKYSKLLPNINEYDYVKVKLDSAFTNLESKIKDKKRDKSVFHFTKGNYFIRCNNFDTAALKFEDAYKLIDSSSSFKNYELSQARILNNKAYALYNHGDIEEALDVINEAIKIIKGLYEALPAKEIEKIKQVWGLCMSTKCEMLWEDSPTKNISKIRELLIEVKINDKTFKFDSRLLSNFPIYKQIIPRAKKDNKWKKYMVSLIQNEVEKSFFLNI